MRPRGKTSEARRHLGIRTVRFFDVDQCFGSEWGHFKLDRQECVSINTRDLLPRVLHLVLLPVFVCFPPLRLINFFCLVSFVCVLIWFTCFLLSHQPFVFLLVMQLLVISSCSLVEFLTCLGFSFLSIFLPPTEAPFVFHVGEFNKPTFCYLILCVSCIWILSFIKPNKKSKSEQKG